MRAPDHFNLLRLDRAITAPSQYQTEHYYYDGQKKVLFNTECSPFNPVKIVILNKSYLRCFAGLKTDLAARIELLGDENCEIIEIPRLQVKEKIRIQLQFLLMLTNNAYYTILVNAVKQQKDEFEFVLDSLLINNEELQETAGYWADFKVNEVFDFLIKFTSRVKPAAVTK